MANPVINLDYLYIDFLQSVQYQQRTAEGAWDNAATIHNCLIDNEVKNALVGEFELAYRTSYWSFWVNELGSLVPQKGDKFTAANNTVWIVENVNDQDLVKCQKYCLQAYTQSLS